MDSETKPVSVRKYVGVCALVYVGCAFIGGFILKAAETRVSLDAMLLFTATYIATYLFLKDQKRYMLDAEGRQMVFGFLAVVAIFQMLVIIAMALSSFDASILSAIGIGLTITVFSVAMSFLGLWIFFRFLAPRLATATLARFKVKESEPTE